MYLHENLIVVLSRLNHPQEKVIYARFEKGLHDPSFFETYFQPENCLNYQTKLYELILDKNTKTFSFWKIEKEKFY